MMASRSGHTSEISLSSLIQFGLRDVDNSGPFGLEKGGANDEIMGYASRCGIEELANAQQ